MEISLPRAHVNIFIFVTKSCGRITLCHRSGRAHARGQSGHGHLPPGEYVASASAPNHSEDSLFAPGFTVAPPCAQPSFRSTGIASRTCRRGCPLHDEWSAAAAHMCRDTKLRHVQGVREGDRGGHAKRDRAGRRHAMDSAHSCYQEVRRPSRRLGRIQLSEGSPGGSSHLSFIDLLRDREDPKSREWHPTTQARGFRPARRTQALRETGRRELVWCPPIEGLCSVSPDGRAALGRLGLLHQISSPAIESPQPKKILRSVVRTPKGPRSPRTCWSMGKPVRAKLKVTTVHGCRLDALPPCHPQHVDVAGGVYDALNIVLANRTLLVAGAQKPRLAQLDALARPGVDDDGAAPINGVRSLGAPC